MEQIIDFPSATEIYAYTIEESLENRNMLFEIGSIVYGLFQYTHTIILDPETVLEYEENGFTSITTQILLHPFGTDVAFYLTVSPTRELGKSHDLRMQVSLQSVLTGLISEIHSYTLYLKSRQKVWVPLKLLNAYQKREGDLLRTFYFFCPHGDVFNALIRTLVITEPEPFHYV